MRDFLIGWVNDIFGEGLFSSVREVLTMNPSTGEFKTVWGIITNIYDNVCVPIGMGLVLIFFMVNIIEKSTQQQSLDVEHVIKLLLKLFVGLYLIEHGMELMASIYALSFSLVNDILGVAGKDFSPDGGLASSVWMELTGEDLADTSIEWGFFDVFDPGLGVLLQLVFPWLISLVLKIIINFVCYSRLIEFYLKTAAAPIALSDFFTEGLHGNGWRFLKGYLAIAVQSGIIMLTVVVFNGVAAGVLGTISSSGYWSFLFKYLALGFATVGLMLKSLSLSKELIGAS